MTREWKPGDVFDYGHARGFFTLSPYGQGEMVWPDGTRTQVLDLKGEPQPTAVIPYEEREQTDRLSALIAQRVLPGQIPTNLDLQRALREFAAPTPPIEEPKRIGSVVEDGDGEVWTRYSDESGSFWINRHGLTQPFRQLASPVEVLSEGVTE